MKYFILISLIFIKLSVAAAQNVVQAEYFIDNDAGVGNNTAVNLANPAADGTYNINLNLAGQSIGYHKIYIRTKDSDGNWSLTSRRNIEITSSGFSKKITGGEYFFDNDPGFSLATAVSISPQDSLILQNFAAATAALPVGYHKLYIRLRDSDGNWSLSARRNMEVISASVYVIAGAEYFFNSDPGVSNANAVAFTLPVSDSSFTFKIPIANIPAGSHTLYIRAKDSVNKSWGLTQWLSDSVVTSVKNGNWSDASVWSNNKVPDAHTVVLLYHNVDIDIVNATCKSLTPYRNSVICTVLAGKALKITGKK